MHKLLNLLKSRHGVYYLPTWTDGREFKKSLGTKDWPTARLLALQFQLSRAMTIRKLDVVFPGLEFRKVDTPDDF